MTDAESCGHPHQRRAPKPDEPTVPRVEHAPRVWRIRSLDAAREVLRARRATTQAGFTAESIPKGRLKHHPILVSDGPLHDEQRSKVARFFAPTVVAQDYVGHMAAVADRLLAQAGTSVALDELALHYAVEVTARIVGLTESPVPAMSRRLVSFFNQPPFDLTKPGLGRTNRQWARAALNALVPIGQFYWRDVRPAIRRRRARRGVDIISHLIDEGYSNVDILIECVTYGTAGMVTTREFITMAAWHLLDNPDLLARYRAGDTTERHAILNEIIRLEPVVGHLYRRVQEPMEIHDADATFHLTPGDLVDICVRAVNSDERAVGEDPLGLCPGRTLPPRVDASVMSFGDGAHRCPGQPLAITETDILLTRLLDRSPRLIRRPSVSWDALIEGYQLRGLVVSCEDPGSPIVAP